MPTTTLTASPISSTPTPFIPIPLKVATSLSHVTTTNATPSLSTTPQNTAATLRPLYSRAVRAFLHRNIVLTHSLLTSAFALITSPSTGIFDSLSEHRRKWEVLRITLEVTVYTAPPVDTASIPAALRSNALLSGAALLAALHTRSVRLFTPADGPAPNPAFLPAQVLVTLALSSVKIGCPTAGRGIIEEWLACRLPAALPENDGYEKVLEVYCLNILPALGEWVYAREFLKYVTELPPQSKEVHASICLSLASSLTSLHEQYLASLPVPPSSSAESSSAVTPTPSRPSSPTPSSSSASSNSTHTAVPANPHPRTSKPKHGRSNGHAIAPLTPTPSSVTLTQSLHDASHRASSRAAPRGNESPARRTQTPVAESRAGSWHALTRAGTTVPGGRTSLSALESLQAMLRPYLRHVPIFLLCVVLPALAVLVRFFRRRPKSILPWSSATTAAVVAGTVAGPGAGASAARNQAVEDVRRRLSGVQGQRGLLGAVWDEAARAIWDTVAMGGRGLV
ncbi:hypothetical protein B0F90DRAFT_1706852 [Multifurca ochricompacta]|uniref:Uncharacterized protein n=1 Tax=Multifurca ochricompacta TaxID=376703 RepID=A0AAD4M8F0_9AGAM|nr:hypothetical protein B0F90DRAFT_1706852 [Multifurca ochricompacta]